MIATDVLLVSIAIAASIVVYLRRHDIRRSGTGLGVGGILAGLWVVSGFYIADFYTMIIMPDAVGMDVAMAAMASLHLNYSWYIYSFAALLVCVGLMLTVLQLTHQLRGMEKRTEELLENENILDSIFENLPVGLLIKNSDHVIERPNRTYLSWYGTELVHMVGQRFDQIPAFQADDDAVIMNAQEDEVLSKGTLVHRRVERYFVDGKPHTLDIKKFPVHDRDGNITKVGSITVDLTELVKAEEAARNALGEAEKANRAKSQFIATMSHEFRTPLNAILGFSEMLRGEYFGPLGADNYRDYAKDIHDSGEHLLGLVNDILDIATIEAGKRTLQKEEFDIAELLCDCMRSVEGLASSRNIALVLHAADDVRPLNADRKAVAQIFLNILANAVKFTEEGGTIDISAGGDDDVLTVCVADTGVGISGDLLPRVTEAFAKGQSNPHVTESGTGLGLSIVKSLVEAHSGELVISSTAGIGTAVYVKLPYSS